MTEPLLLIPTNQALDRLLEHFLDKLGVTDPIINEDLIMEAFYAGAQSMMIIEELQEVTEEKQIEGLINDGFATVEQVNAVLSEVVFEEANYGGGEA